MPIHHATPDTGLLPYYAVLCYGVPCPVQTVSPVWTTLDPLVDSGSLDLLDRPIAPATCRGAPCQGSARRGSGSLAQGQSTGTGSGGDPFRAGANAVYYQSVRTGPGGALCRSPFFTPVLGHFRGPCRGLCRGCHFCDEKWVKKGLLSMRFLLITLWGGICYCRQMWLYLHYTKPL